jgi:hypothetical protein
MKHGGGIALFDGVENRAIPDVDAILKADIGDDQDHEPDGKYPRQPVAAFAPKSLGADPEPRQQIILAGLLGLFGRKIRVGLEDLGRRRLDMLAGFGCDLDEGGFFFGTLGLRQVSTWPDNAKEIRRFRLFPPAMIPAGTPGKPRLAAAKPVA